MNNIDLVYPCHSKDREVLQLCIKYAKQNIKNLNNIYVVSKTKLTNEAIWISNQGSRIKVLVWVRMGILEEVWT